MKLRSTASAALVAAALIAAPALAPVAALAQSTMSAPATPKLIKVVGVIKSVHAGVATLETGQQVFFDASTVYTPRKPNLTDSITIYATKGAGGTLQAKKVVINK